MSTNSDLSRRQFLGRAAGVSAAIAAPYIVPSSSLAAPGRKGPNDKINVGIIGTGGLAMGWHLPEMLKLTDTATITALCDVWKPRLDKAAEVCGNKPKTYADWRELIADPNVDAVIIVTPPHWHTLMAVAAAEAKKDFYLEKPMTNNVAESVVVLNAVRKHDVITQVGTQIHASDNFRRVVEYIRSGQLGKIGVVRTFNIMNQGPEGIGNTPDSDPPAGMDWEMWLGPGPNRKFNAQLAEGAYTHSSFMVYTGGWTPGMGPHIIDMPYWAMDLDIPLRTTCSGGRYIIKDCGDAPDVQEVLWDYGGFTMTWFMSLVNSYGFDFQGKGGMERRLGVYFHGINGTLMADYGSLRIVPEGDRMKDAQTPPQTIPASKGHHREWLDGIRTREQPLCHVGYHHKLDLAIQLANLSMRVKRTINFDPKTLKIIDDAEATRLAKPEYRAPWKFPDQYLS